MYGICLQCIGLNWDTQILFRSSYIQPTFNLSTVSIFRYNRSILYFGESYHETPIRICHYIIEHHSHYTRSLYFGESYHETPIRICHYIIEHHSHYTRSLYFGESYHETPIRICHYIIEHHSHYTRSLYFGESYHETPIRICHYIIEHHSHYTRSLKPPTSTTPKYLWHMDALYGFRSDLSRETVQLLPASKRDPASIRTVMVIILY